MNLTFILQFFEENRGSYEGVFEQLARRIDAEVTILCAKKPGQAQQQKLGYAKVIRFPVRYPSLFTNVFVALQLARYVRHYLKHHDPGIIIANGEASLGVKDHEFIHRTGDQPVPVFAQNMDMLDGSLMTKLARKIHYWMLHQLEKRYVPKAKAYITSSRQTKKLFLQHYPTTKPFFIPHAGVDIQQQRSGTDLKFKGRNMLFIGGSHEKERKGILYLEQVLPQLFAQHHDLHLIHLGRQYSWKVPRKFKQRIISPGRVPWDRMPDYFASADFYVSCAVHEMFPNTIIEAIASGLPVVIGDIQGAYEYVDHKKTGYIYRRADTAALKKGIEYALSHRFTAKDLSSIDYETYSKELLDFITQPENMRLLP